VEARCVQDGERSMADFIAVRCLACCPQTLGAQLAKSRGDLRRKTRSSRADAHGKTVPLTGPVSAPGRMSAPTASATGAWPPPMSGAPGRIQLVNATVWLNISAGVWKQSVFLGLSFNCLANPLSFACE